MNAMPVAEFEPLPGEAEPFSRPETVQYASGGLVPPDAATPIHADESVVPPAPEAPKDEEEEEKEDVLEIILPSADPRELKIMTIEGQVAQVYTQNPLTYLRKMQFFKLVAKTLKAAIDESGPEVVADIFGGGITGLGNTLSQRDFDDAGGFMTLILSVVELSEEFIEDAYVIWLGVPPSQREWAKAAMRGDVGGIVPLSDEDGVAILKTFVVQNWGAMQAFFRVHAKEVFQVAREQQRRVSSQRED